MSLVGREAEMEIIGRLLEGASFGRSGVALFGGEAGIGKSALLDHARHQAHGISVLRATGVRAEAELRYAALHQLLRPLLDRAGSLPKPQSAALRSALGVAADRAADPFLVGLAVLGLLTDAAQDRPLLCLVDDAAWLDYDSAAAIAFAARRLAADSVVILLAAREVESSPLADLPAWSLRGLGQDQASELLAIHYPGLDPLVRDRVIERASGNPLALMELPGRLADSGQEMSAPFAVALAPTAVDALYLERTRRLPAASQLLLLVAAAEDSPALGLVLRAASRLAIQPEALEPAEREQIISVEQDRIRFLHPLARSAAYTGATSIQRRRVHNALAEAWGPDEPDRRAWHRAAATLGPDEKIARELESTACQARLRGGQAAASAALERAAQLSAGAGARAARLVSAAEAAWQAGHADRAAALLERAPPLPDSPRLQARAAEVRGLARAQRGQTREAASALATAAAAIGDGHEPQRAMRLTAVAAETAWFGGDEERLGLLHVLAGSLPAEPGPVDGFMRGYVLALAVTLRLGVPTAAALLRAAIARTADLSDPRALAWAGDCAMLLGDLRVADELYARAVGRSRELPSVGDLVHILHLRARCELALGKIAAAEADASEALRLGREMKEAGVEAHGMSLLARVAALRGNGDECRRYAAGALKRAVPDGLELAASAAVLAKAELELSIGRPGDALDRLEPIIADKGGHPAYLIEMTITAVEAAARARVPERGLPALELCAEWVDALGAPALLPVLARCRGLLSEGPQAGRYFAQALRLHQEQTIPLDLARTRLCRGEQLRRAGQRAAARPHLRAALETFDSLGATLLADRAAGELRASGETTDSQMTGRPTTGRPMGRHTTGRHAASAVSGLTPQELQIASLVVAGGSNREVAARVFLSQKTVEYHLHKVFTKLGAASRADLADIADEIGLTAMRSGPA